jgi:hypothetical protein
VAVSPLFRPIVVTAVADFSILTKTSSLLCYCCCPTATGCILISLVFGDISSSTTYVHTAAISCIALLSGQGGHAFLMQPLATARGDSFALLSCKNQHNDDAVLVDYDLLEGGCHAACHANDTSASSSWR